MLPFLSRKRTATIQGDPGTWLAGYLGETITVPPETMRDSVSSSLCCRRRRRRDVTGGAHGGASPVAHRRGKVC